MDKMRKYNFKRLVKMPNDGIISVLDSLFRRHDDDKLRKIWHVESAKFAKSNDDICISWWDFEDLFSIIITDAEITRIVETHHYGKKTDVMFVNPSTIKKANHV